jgi:hypothetical protein
MSPRPRCPDNARFTTGFLIGGFWYEVTVKPGTLHATHERHMADRFLTLANLKECESRFKTFSATRFGRTLADADLRRELFEAMQEVSRTGLPGGSLREMNNAVLNRVLDAFGKELSSARHEPFSGQQPGPRAGQMRRLESDADVFGDRGVAFNTLLPVASTGDAPGNRGTVAKAFERAVGSRRAEEFGAPAAHPGAEALREEDVRPLDEGEFMRRFSRMARERESAIDIVPPPPPPGEDDPAAGARAAVQAADAFKLLEASSGVGVGTNMGNMRQEALLAGDAMSMAMTTATTMTTRYLVVSGADRSWDEDPYRNRYRVSTVGGEAVNTLLGTYRNISWIEATRVMVPIESGVSETPGPLSGFSHPFLLLQVDGMEGALDGTAEPVRRSLAVMVFESSYKAPNGRGYLVLKPASDERRTFATPLASLPNLRISLVKPNGTLLNNAVDAYTLNTIQYEAINRLFVKIVMDQFFDRNEFFVGDTVRFKGFEARGAIEDSIVNALNQFVNRFEGHEITRLGERNDQGFVKSFYILAPGVLDQTAGRVIIDPKMTSAIQALEPSSDTRASVINASLQHVITFRLGTQTASPPAAMLATAM